MDSDTTMTTPACRQGRRQCSDCGADFIIPEFQVFGQWLPACTRCEPCHAAALAAHAKREAEGHRLEREKLWADEIGRDAFTDTDREQFQNPALYDKVLAWTYGPQGLVIHGKSGRGKSRALWALVHRLFVLEGRYASVLRATAFARAVLEAGPQVDALVKRLGRVPVLAIDDLGAESVSERWEAALLEVIDRRMVANLPLLLTTNYVGGKLVARFRNPSTGDAIVRRIRERCTGVCA